MCTGACGGQRTASDLLEVEFLGAENHHVGAGRRTEVFCKIGKSSELPSWLRCTSRKFLNKPSVKLLETGNALLIFLILT